MLLVLVIAVAVKACRGHQKVAAKVGSASITEGQVAQVLGHAREEAQREGHAFPQEGSPPYRFLRRQAIDLLVYQEELRQKARSLGITVGDSEVNVPAGGGETESGDDPAFALEGARSALLYRRVYDRVTRGVRVGDAEIRAYYRRRRARYLARGMSLAAARPAIRRDLLETRRNATMSRWIAEMKRDFAPRVSYR